MARDRHQALEPRWAKGIWLGHARSTNAALVATSEGVIKVWGFRRLPEGQQWDGDRIRSIRGSPKDWKLDASEDSLQVELLDGGLPQEVENVEPMSGPRTGERISMYLKRSDFDTYGFTDGCPGCRDISTGRSGPSSGWAAHTGACRRRMEEAIQVAEPARWERHLRRRRDGEAGEAVPSAPAAAEAEDDDARSSP